MCVFGSKFMHLGFNIFWILGWFTLWFLFYGRILVLEIIDKSFFYTIYFLLHAFTKLSWSKVY
jgi:hypothetical protein